MESLRTQVRAKEKAQAELIRLSKRYECIYSNTVQTIHVCSRVHRCCGRLLHCIPMFTVIVDKCFIITKASRRLIHSKPNANDRTTKKAIQRKPSFNGFFYCAATRNFQLLCMFSFIIRTQLSSLTSCAKLALHQFAHNILQYREVPALLTQSNLYILTTNAIF